MKKMLSVLAGCIAFALIASLAACGEAKDTKATEAAAETVAATEASTEAAQDETFNESEQEKIAMQQKAVSEAIARTAELHGEEDWLVYEVTETVDSANNACYYVGITADSVPDVYFYYVDPGHFCYEAGQDDAALEYPDEVTKKSMEQQKAIQNAIIVATQAYGLRDWRPDHIIDSVDPHGIECYYVSLLDYDGTNYSPVYFFYCCADGTVYPDEEANAKNEN